MSDVLSAILARIQKRTATVGIIGLGYVGLPLARAFTDGWASRPRLRRRPAKVAKLNARRELHRPHPRRRPSPGCAAAGFEATDRFDRLDEPDAIIICVPTPLTETREPDLTYVVELGPGDRRPASARAARRAGKHDLPRHDARCRAADPGGRRACRGPRLLPRLQPRARGPGQPDSLRRRPSPRSSAASTTASLEAACALYGQVIVPKVVRVSSARGGRGVQDPGEHLPGHQHRAGQRAEGALRPHGHRRLGGDRRGQDQAVRLPGLLPRARAWAGTASRSTRST